MGVAGAASLATASTVWGAAAMFVVIGLIFVGWRYTGGEFAWAGLVVCGVLMCGVLSWAYSTEYGCPAKTGGVEKRLTLEDDKPTVGCKEIKGSYRSMAMLFAGVGAVGLVIGLRAIGRRE